MPPHWEDDLCLRPPVEITCSEVAGLGPLCPWPPPPQSPAPTQALVLSVRGEPILMWALQQGAHSPNDLPLFYPFIPGSHLLVGGRYRQLQDFAAILFLGLWHYNPGHSLLQRVISTMVFQKERPSVAKCSRQHWRARLEHFQGEPSGALLKACPWPNPAAGNTRIPGDQKPLPFH